MAGNIFLGEAEFRKIFRDHLRIEAFPKSIDSLFSPRMRAKVNYSPYYQRHYVWDIAKATYFIESLLLGTEIPPLVFFSSSNKVEVIDGRQRYETIKRFMDDKFALGSKGLDRLKKLVRASYSKLPDQISALFLDTKIRIIQFEIIGEPPLDATLEDKIKKEIFRRYNTGITPLRKAELDNAVYDSDELTAFLKDAFQKEPTTARRVQDLFLHVTESTATEVNIQQVLQFVRRMVVLWKYPIRNYARSSGRSEILERLYDHFAQHDCESPESVFAQIERIVTAIWKLREQAEKKGVKTNRFFLECVSWAMLILEQEERDSVKEVQAIADDLLKLCEEKAEVYFHDASHYFYVIVDRYTCTAQFFEQRTGVDFSIYISGTEEMVKNLKGDQRTQETETQISQLGELRVNKPDPSKLSIDDIMKKMRRRRFLLRPSYQRGEVISPTKASGIIESILLDVALPPIFVFRRNDDVSEVVDGQQRLLTILGFIGEHYLNEKNEQVFPKKHRFALRDLRILTELSGKRFDDLSDEQRGKIFDFELFEVEIQQSINPHFDPVDLFVRLNDRPYPIKEHSFEMWNSWADKDSITKIKENTQRASTWFYVRKRRADDRYRMQNEELYTALVYFDYNSQQHGATKHPTLFLRRDYVAARVADKADISTIWAKVSEDIEAKQKWLESTNRVEAFLRKLRIVLVDHDVEGSVADFLRNELDRLLQSPAQRVAVRTFQDFYILWLLLSPLNLEMVRANRLAMKADVTSIMQSTKARSDARTPDATDPVTAFASRVADFHERYRREERRTKLTDEEKINLLQEQKGVCPLSGAPIFRGDELEIDHKEPLAVGGSDTKANLQISSPEANRRKGARR